MRHYFYFLCFISFSINAQNNLGCIPEDVDTTRIIKKEFEVTRDALPINFNLKKYAPEVMNQGALGSCTAWATAYAGFTITQRIEHNDLNYPAASPLNLYNRLKIKENQDPCSDGSHINKALMLLKDYGCDKYVDSTNYCQNISAVSLYENKLFDFDYLSITAINIKSALVQKNPVIVSLPCYDDGWNNFYNLDENGVWNGEHDTILKGHHAMCIIGYDDTLANGSFLIMNSWGTDWGNEGYFWLKYTDISIIRNAYVLYSNPDKKTQENTNQKFRVYNECSKTIYITTSIFKENDWITKGWYPVESNSYCDIEIGDRENDQFYWLAFNNSNNLWWTDELNGRSFCIDPVHRFEYYENDNNNNCDLSKLFYSDKPGFSEPYCIRTLTCSTADTRGEKIVIANSESYHFNKNLSSNFNWKSGELLFDHMTGNIIPPLDGFEEKVYSVYYIKNNKVKHLTGNSQRIEKLKAFKFSNEENALNFLGIGK